MTQGCVVIEARRNSGALITTKFANDFGRQIFAVPGRIDSPQSKGCHDLIKNGAKLCESAEDILDEFEYLFPASKRPNSAAETGQLPGLDLSDEEAVILDLLNKGELTVDEIIRGTKLAPAKANVVLLGLQMKKLIRQSPGRVYERAR